MQVSRFEDAKTSKTILQLQYDLVTTPSASTDDNVVPVTECEHTPTGTPAFVAHFLSGYTRQQEYIITQHPSTDDDRHMLWHMVWQHACEMIVVLRAPAPCAPAMPFWPISTSMLSSAHTSRTLVADDPMQHRHCAHIVVRALQEWTADNCTISGVDLILHSEDGESDFELQCRLLVVDGWRMDGGG